MASSNTSIGHVSVSNSDVSIGAAVADYDIRPHRVKLRNAGANTVYLSGNTSSPNSERWPLKSDEILEFYIDQGAPLSGSLYGRTASGSSDVIILWEPEVHVR